jgi:hypothetical protein
MAMQGRQLAFILVLGNALELHAECFIRHDVT